MFLSPSRMSIALACLAAAPALGAPPTFYKDVLPILQEHCQGCHREGEIGPMAFVDDYAKVRPWARAIRQSVLTRTMPPWFADPAHGAFANDRALPQEAIDRIVAWVDAGAPAGDAADAPPPRTFTEGWNIGEPDYVVQMPQPFTIPASGKVDYQYIVVPLNLTEDKWVQMVEARPAWEARSAVHHILVFVRSPRSPWLRGEAEPGVPFVPPRTTPDGKPRNDIAGGGNEILTIYTPGNVPDIWEPGTAKLIRAGSDLVLQMHYTPSGKEVVDQSRIGFVWAREPVERRAITFNTINMDFTIPPMAAAHTIDAQPFPIRSEAWLYSFFPHMHLRGKSFEYTLRQPDGATQTLLRVPNYDFNWQLTYKLKEPIPLAPGARILSRAVFDNSPNNPHNPDPQATVRWGEQSDEEMMIGFFDVLIDARADIRNWLTGHRPPANED
jgi:hypothetical protein